MKLSKLLISIPIIKLYLETEDLIIGKSANGFPTINLEKDLSIMENGISMNLNRCDLNEIFDIELDDRGRIKEIKPHGIVKSKLSNEELTIVIDYFKGRSLK